MLKKQIKIKITENSEKRVVFLRPETYEVARKLRLLYAQEYGKLIKFGVITKSGMLDLLKKEGIWTDREEDMLNDLLVRVGLLEQALDTTDKTDVTKTREVVVKLMKARNDMLELLQIKTEPLAEVAESIAEDIQRENFLVESCFYEDGKKYFTSYDDFKNRRYEDNTEKIYGMFLRAINLHHSDMLLSLPENKWLVDNKFMSKDGDILDKELAEQVAEELKKEEPVKV